MLRNRFSRVLALMWLALVLLTLGIFLVAPKAHADWTSAGTTSYSNDEIEQSFTITIAAAGTGAAQDFSACDRALLTSTTNSDTEFTVYQCENEGDRREDCGILAVHTTDAPLSSFPVSVANDYLKIWTTDFDAGETLTATCTGLTGTSWSAAGGAWVRAVGGGVSGNVPTDTDGDGSTDYIQCGDYDGDGTTEIDDINACFAVLTGSPKHVFVLPGSYAAPASTANTQGLIELASNETLECAGSDLVTLHGSQFIQGTPTATQIDLAVVANGPSNAGLNIQVLNCGIDGGVRSGWSWDASDIDLGAETIKVQDPLGNDIDPLRDDHRYQNGDGPVQLVNNGTLPTCTPACAVATDYWIIRNDADTVRLAASYADALAGTAINITAAGGDGNSFGVDMVDQGLTYNNSMGFYFRGIAGLVLRGNKVWSTGHSCIYVSNAQNFKIIDSDMDLCGNFNNPDGGVGFAQQPGIYIFSVLGVPTYDGLVQGNRCSRAGAACYNTRASDFSAGDRMDHIAWLGNSASRLLTKCLSLASTRHNTVNGIACDQTGGIIVQTGTSEWLEHSIGPNQNANVDVSITGFHLSNMNSGSGLVALQVGSYNENVTIGSGKIYDTGDNTCVGITQPVRGVVFSDMTLERCGRSGMFVSGVTPDGGGFGITFRNIDIIDTDWFDITGAPQNGAFQAAAQQRDLIFEDITVKGTNQAIDFQNGVSHSVFKNMKLSGTPTGWWGNNIAIADLPVCNEHTENLIVQVNDANGYSDCTAAGGASTNKCRCQSTVWTDMTDGSVPINDKSLIWVRNGTGDCINNVFENITGYDVMDGWTIDIDEACVDNVFTNIHMIDRDLSEAGANFPFGALSLAAGVTNALVMSDTFNCVNVDEVATDCFDRAADDDLAAGSVVVDEACSGACTDGVRCIDRDGGAGAILFVCGDAAPNLYNAP